LVNPRLQGPQVNLVAIGFTQHPSALRSTDANEHGSFLGQHIGRFNVCLTSFGKNSERTATFWTNQAKKKEKKGERRKKREGKKRREKKIFLKTLQATVARKNSLG